MSSTWACSRAASAVAFWAGSRLEIFACAPSLAATAASSAPSPPVDDVLQLLDFPPRHDVGVAPVQLLLGLQLVDGLLQRALRLLDLALGCGEVGFGDDHRRHRPP